MTFIWTHEALEKLNEIEKFIGRDSPKRAEEFINFLIERCESILKNPKIGRTVTEISNPEIREIIIKKYRIIYRIRADKMEILTVFEGHRLLRIDELKVD